MLQGCKDHTRFWPPLKHTYAASDETSELKLFIDNALQSTSKEHPLKLYCQLTPEWEDIVLKRYFKDIL